MADFRPDPEALLAQLKGEERSARGRLKVYLGMAAGVGKTYAMLSAARECRKRGIDVVLGYLEPHGRAETEAMAEGLETLPERVVGHRNITMKEFDLDAALLRKPTLILVDELAHSNAMGSRHRKRWQDIEELLQAGIDVHTTINVQHIESLRDTVAKITGVVVGETVPDALITGADEVELVDIPPEELIQRLQEGKIYEASKVQQALERFFRKGNLLALRKLALRQTTERVDQQVRTFRSTQRGSEPWRTAERIMVGIAPSPLSARLVRESRRLANSLHAELLAVWVDAPRAAGISEQDRKAAQDALELAEELGAETIVLAGSDIVGQVLSLARDRNVTTIVVGKPVRSRWLELVSGSVADELIRASGDINIHVISGGVETGPRSKIQRETPTATWKSYGMVVLMGGLCTLIGLGMQGRFDLANIVMIYLLGVTLIAFHFGQREAALASLLSVGLFDFCFVNPRWSFAVSDVQFLVTFGVMLLVSLLISSLTSRLKSQATSLSLRERRTAALYDLSKKMSRTRSRREIGEFAAMKIQEVFGGEVAVLVRSRKSGDLFGAPESKSGFEREPNERGVAKWVLEHSTRAGTETDTLPGSAGLYLPLVAETGCVGVLALRPVTGQLDDAGRMHLLETFANQLAVAIERTNMAKDSHDASLSVETERLRSTLLSSVSHDLRTPLAVIVGAAETLKETMGPNPVRDRELAISIHTEADHLNRLVRNLLDMTRLETQPVSMHRDWHSLEELIGSALSRTEVLIGERSVHLDFPADLPLVFVDGLLFEQVFVNLLENAAKYSSPPNQIWIQASTHAPLLRITFANDGPSLLAGEEERIFGKFQRLSANIGGGCGLGLAICRAIVESHGGIIYAENRLGSGVQFILELPLMVIAPSMATRPIANE